MNKIPESTIKVLLEYNRVFGKLETVNHIMVGTGYSEEVYYFDGEKVFHAPEKEKSTEYEVIMSCPLRGMYKSVVYHIRFYNVEDLEKYFRQRIEALHETLLLTNDE